MAAIYNITHTLTKSVAEDAQIYATQEQITYALDDIIILYPNASHTSGTEIGNYKYSLEYGSESNYIWVPTIFSEIPAYDPTELFPGSATSFRTNLNSNFGLVEGQSDCVRANLIALYGSLAPVATSNLAGDINDDSTHRFVTDEQKENWSSRINIDNGTVTKVTWDSTTGEESSEDITSDVIDLIETRVNVPTSTDELTNDAGFISSATYDPSEVRYITNYNVTTCELDNPLTTIEGYYKEEDKKFYQESTYITEIIGEIGKRYIDQITFNNYIWNGTEFTLVSGELVYKCIILTGITDADFDDKVANIIFSQATAQSGNYSQTSETAVGANNAGLIYFWSKVKASVSSPLSIPLIVIMTGTTA